MKTGDRSKSSLIEELKVLRKRIKKLEDKLSHHIRIGEKLSQAEAKWRSITESTPDHIVTTDPDLKIQFVNHPSPGQSVDNLIGKPLYKLVAPDRQDAVKKILLTVLNTGKPDSYETEYVSPDGQRIYYESRVVAWRMPGSEQIAGLTISARDITRQKYFAQDREKLIKKLENAVTKVNTLSGLLPICATCKKIRDDKGYWTQLETYIHDHSNAEFSHGLCPDCTAKLYPDLTPPE